MTAAGSAFPQPTDFREESEALYRLLEPLDDTVFGRPTQFKDWRVEDVLSHLHLWNWAADLSLSDPGGFDDFRSRLLAHLADRGTLRAFEGQWLEGLAGRALLDRWHSFAGEMSERFSRADPKRRVAWAGPDMSVRSSITARLMETWAHGQEIYDLLGVRRRNEDRIKNIAILGMNTFGWTFSNRGIEVPDRVPQVRLTAPSGDTWSWNDSENENLIEGSAEEFCQVVTQVRNVADTTLVVRGGIAERWMSIAQCFAGPPEDPPAPGTRYTLPPSRA